MTARGASIGCDLGGTAIKWVRLEGRRVAASLEVATPAGESARRIIDAIAGGVLRLASPERQGQRRGGRPPAGERIPVGVAVPGFLDPARERVIRLSNIPRLDGVPLRRELERRLRTRVVLDADTNAGAVGEAVLGAGRGFERVLYLTVGTGLGAALAVGGIPARVSNHTVGQVAHLPLAEDGPLCPCGRRGCAEALLSAHGLIRRARGRGLRRRVTPEELFRLALGRRASRERAIARATWRETGDLVGRLARVLASLFSPQVIVLGGGLAGASELFLERAEAELGRRRNPRLAPPPRILPSLGGRLAGAAGMAILARAPRP